jgi:hypothetical protein
MAYSFRKRRRINWRHIVPKSKNMWWPWVVTGQSVVAVMALLAIVCVEYGLEPSDLSRALTVFAALIIAVSGWAVMGRLIEISSLSPMGNEGKLKELPNGVVKVRPPELDRPGKVRRFLARDEFTPIHGWNGIDGHPLLGLYNPRGWAALHIVVQRLIDGVYKDMYDQVLLIEDPGVIVVCMQGDMVALVPNFRFTAKRLDEGVQSYVKKLSDENRWEELSATLGRWNWEAPRGISPASMDDQASLAARVIQIARLEALAEAGFELSEVKVCGMCNPNSTFFAHEQYVVRAKIERVGRQAPEAFEMLQGVALFTKDEVRAMMANGQLTDGLTIGALAIAGFFDE